MENFKSKITDLKSNQGFTLIELLVVMAIMAMLGTALIINLGGQRINRDLKLAQSQLASNLRKAQSYTLSSRLLPDGQTAQYYLLKFNTTTPEQYSIQAMSNTNSSPQYLHNVETIKLPTSVILSDIVISRPNYPYTQTLSGGCALVAFASPFGKIYFNDGCSQTGSMSEPYSIQTADDYKKIVDFVGNLDCVSSGNPAACTASNDATMTITLADKSNPNNKRTVTVNGIIGAVTFSQ